MTAKEIKIVKALIKKFEKEEARFNKLAKGDRLLCRESYRLGFRESAAMGFNMFAYELRKIVRKKE